MNIPLLIRLLFLHKWWLLLPCILAPCFAVFLLITAEPVYISGTKLWVKPRSEDSSFLKIQRSGSDTDTHIGVQSQIIKSNRVLLDVIKKRSLEVPPPSRSILGKIRNKDGSSDNTELPTEVQTIKALHESIQVSILNPEILIISARMNDPELAQKLVQATLDSYIENAVALSLEEVDKHEEYLKAQLTALDGELQVAEKAIIDFEVINPEVLGGGELPVLGLSSPTFARDTADVGPVPLLARKLAELELKRNQLATTIDPSSFELKSLDAEIKADRELLQSYQNSLSEQAKLAVQHDKLHWSLQKMREARTLLDGEVRKIGISRGSKLAEQSGITVLDPPSFDDQRVSPKRKNLLIGSVILGAFAGLGLVVLRSLFDPTYTFAGQLESELELPVLAELPADLDRDES